MISARVGEKDDTVGKQDRFKSLIAVGNVHIVQGEREATCARAEVRPREDRITLTGNLFWQKTDYNWDDGSSRSSTARCPRRTWPRSVRGTYRGSSFWSTLTD